MEILGITMYISLCIGVYWLQENIVDLLIILSNKSK